MSNPEVKDPPEAKQVDPALEREARGMGWKPEGEFRGDPKNWTDAETYVKRGREFIPILRAENSRQKAELDALHAKQAELTQTLQGAQEAIEALKEYQTSATKEAVTKAKKDLVSELKKAREDEDVEREAEIIASIGELDAATREAAKPAAKAPAKEPTKTEPKVDPAFEGWVQDNAWWNTDRRKRALAIGIADDLRAQGNKLEGRAFFDKVSEELDTMLGERRVGKADGGGSGGGGGGNGGGNPEPKARSYDDLDKEAKAACNSLSAKLVGPGKAFKDEAGWRAHYAKEYFAGEQA